MWMRFLFFILFSTFLVSLKAQNEDCNHLGVWLWHFETTQYPTHGGLADRLKSMGIKRIYVKVADGGVNTTVWPELIDKDLVNAYKERGLEVWAWSYNYQGNEENQAKAIYEAAKTGYDGFVIDIEIEFNGESIALQSLLTEFDKEKHKAIAEGFADEHFKLYVTTWGNPELHNYRIDIIDRFVDAFMPQTYVEEWGQPHLSNIPACIEEVQLEYESLGATKPLHHILSTARELLGPDQINTFFSLSGPETSLWRIPGGGVSQSVWDTWYECNWEMDFCETVDSEILDESHFDLFPNPTSGNIWIRGAPKSKAYITSLSGTILQSFELNGKADDQYIYISEFPGGSYILKLQTEDSVSAIPLIKY